MIGLSTFSKVGLGFKGSGGLGGFIGFSFITPKPQTYQVIEAFKDFKATFRVESSGSTLGFVQASFPQTARHTVRFWRSGCGELVAVRASRLRPETDAAPAVAQLILNPASTWARASWPCSGVLLNPSSLILAVSCTLNPKLPLNPFAWGIWQWLVVGGCRRGLMDCFGIYVGIALGFGMGSSCFFLQGGHADMDFHSIRLKRHE